jgi:Holliday junction resolvase RusA-like endonuclease|tara:strand:+ start:420 stop:830 length:411 start_codon:yes stop_codon:yes gene_type:complete
MNSPLDTGPFIAVVPGEPASKSNQRQFVKIHGVPRFIKSKKALAYANNFSILCPTRDSLYIDDLFLGVKVFYKTKRPDLDETLVLDLLQGKAYKNDRQVKARLALWGLDRSNPRVHIFVAPIAMMDEGIEYLLALD